MGDPAQLKLNVSLKRTYPWLLSKSERGVGATAKTEKCRPERRLTAKCCTFPYGPNQTTLRLLCKGKKNTEAVRGVVKIASTPTCSSDDQYHNGMAANSLS